MIAPVDFVFDLEEFPRVPTAEEVRDFSLRDFTAPGEGVILQGKTTSWNLCAPGYTLRFDPSEPLWTRAEEGLIPWTFDEASRVIRVHLPTPFMCSYYSYGDVIFATVTQAGRVLDLTVAPGLMVGVDMPSIVNRDAHGRVVSHLHAAPVPLYRDGAVCGLLVHTRGAPGGTLSYAICLPKASPASSALRTGTEVQVVMAPVCFADPRLHKVRAYVPIAAHIITDPTLRAAIGAALDAYVDLLDTPPSEPVLTMLWDAFREQLTRTP